MFRFAGILLFLAACSPCNAKSTFFQPVTSYPLQGAISIGLADLNGDGLLDLVIGTQSPNAVEVFLGSGDGTFQAATSYSVADTVISVALADVNGDSKPDLVVATFGGFSLFIANGDGTFQPAKEFSLPSVAGTSGVAIADLNRDGKPDIVISFVCEPGFDDCGHGGAVGVLLGNGKGGFGAAKIYSSVGAYAIAVAVADMNRDGNLDIVVDNADTVAVLIGNGDGTLQAAANYDSGGINDASLAIADFNGDGFPDVAIVLPCEGRNCNGYVGVLLNAGNGTLKKTKRYASGGVAATGVAIADLNGDGNPDLLITNACDNLECDNSELGVLLGHGDGTFAPSQHYYSGEDAGVNISPSLAVGDINRDGNPDVVVINGGNGGGGFGVLLSLAKSSTTLASSPNPSVQGQAVVFTATVTSLGSQAPTGKVIFQNGGKSIGSAMVKIGIASLTRKNLPVGNLSIAAEYVGDAETHESISAPLVQVVNPD
jgi:hypothetical protein